MEYNTRALSLEHRNQLKQEFFNSIQKVLFFKIFNFVFLFLLLLQLLILKFNLMDDLYAREQYAKCLNEITKKEFISEWPSFFDDCIETVHHGVCICTYICIKNC